VKQYWTKEQRQYYGERVIKSRNDVINILVTKPQFLNAVRDFKMYHFNNRDRELKQEFDNYITELDFDNARDICRKLDPKFSRISEFIYEHDMSDDEELAEKIGDFFFLCNLYYTVYKNLIYKILHSNARTHLFEFEELIQESYFWVIYTVSLYDYHKAEFGTLLGRNINFILQSKTRNYVSTVDLELISKIVPAAEDTTLYTNDLKNEIRNIILQYTNDEIVLNVCYAILDNSHDARQIAKHLSISKKRVCESQKILKEILQNHPIVKELKRA